MTCVVVGWGTAKVPAPFDPLAVRFSPEGSPESPCPPQEPFQISVPCLPQDCLELMKLSEHKCKVLEWQLNVWKKSYLKQTEEVQRLQDDKERLRKESYLQQGQQEKMQKQQAMEEELSSLRKALEEAKHKELQKDFPASPSPSNRSTDYVSATGASCTSSCTFSPNRFLTPDRSPDRNSAKAPSCQAEDESFQESWRCLTKKPWKKDMQEKTVSRASVELCSSEASNQEEAQRLVIGLHEGSMPEAPLPFLPGTPPPTCAGKANFRFEGPEVGNERSQNPRWSYGSTAASERDLILNEVCEKKLGGFQTFTEECEETWPSSDFQGDEWWAAFLPKADRLESASVESIAVQTEDLEVPRSPVGQPLVDSTEAPRGEDASPMQELQKVFRYVASPSGSDCMTHYGPSPGPSCTSSCSSSCTSSPSRSPDGGLAEEPWRTVPPNPWQKYGEEAQELEDNAYREALPEAKEPTLHNARTQAEQERNKAMEEALSSLKAMEKKLSSLQEALKEAMKEKLSYLQGAFEATKKELSSLQEALKEAELPQVTEEATQQETAGLILGGSPPEELLTVLLDFLPVAEVAELQTRAVSRFFANPQVWVAHLFKLMDIDSVLEHSGAALSRSHPLYEFVRYESALFHDGFERAAEIARDGPEGFQGYRLWFNGHIKWHTHQPERSSHFVQVAMEWFRCDKRILNLNLGSVMCRTFLTDGIRDLRLDIAKGLLPVLTEHSSSLTTCRNAMACFEACQIAFPFLSKTFALKLLELSLRWMEQEDDSWQELRSNCRTQMLHILDAILPDDEAHWARRCSSAMVDARRHGKPHLFEAKKKALIDLLSG